MLGVGRLGAGRIGQVHAEAIACHSGRRLAAVGVELRDTGAILADAKIAAMPIAASTDSHSDRAG